MGTQKFAVTILIYLFFIVGSGVSFAQEALVVTRLAEIQANPDINGITIKPLIAWSPDGELLAVIQDEVLFVFDGNIGEELASIELMDQTTALAFNHDGTKLVVVGITALIINVDELLELGFIAEDEFFQTILDGELLYSAIDSQDDIRGQFGITHVQFNHDSSVLMTFTALPADNENQIRFWDIRQPFNLADESSYAQEIGSIPNELQFDFNTIVTTLDGFYGIVINDAERQYELSLITVDTESGSGIIEVEIKASFAFDEMPSNPIFDLSADISTLSAYTNFDDNYTVSFIKIADDETVAYLSDIEADTPIQLTISSNGRFFAWSTSTALDNHTVQFRGTESRELLTEAAMNASIRNQGFVFSPNNQKLAIAMSDGTLELFVLEGEYTNMDTATDEQTQTFPLIDESLSYGFEAGRYLVAYPEGWIAIPFVNPVFVVVNNMETASTDLSLPIPPPMPPGNYILIMQIIEESGTAQEILIDGIPSGDEYGQLLEQTQFHIDERNVARAVLKSDEFAVLLYVVDLDDGSGQRPVATMVILTAPDEPELMKPVAESMIASIQPIK